MDFAGVKEKLSIKAVLKRYGLDGGLTEHGSTLTGPCPLHRGDNPGAFSVSLDRNLYYCFTRKHGGSVIDLIMELEGVTAEGAYGKALEILNSPEGKANWTPSKMPENWPLPMELKLDPVHPYLDGRHIDISTRQLFGIGYCRTSRFSGRVCIPIHDEHGSLVAYAGRSIGSRQPRYLVPKGFRKSLVLYNYHRARDSSSSFVVVTEGFFDVFRLYQAGFLAVALMGSTMSPRQKELLLSLQRTLVLMFDGDAAGRQCTDAVAESMKGEAAFVAVWLKEGQQPDSLPEGHLRRLLQMKNLTDSQIGDYMTIGELAEKLKVSRGYIYNLCYKHRIPYRKIGRLVRFLPSEIEEWIDSQTVSETSDG